MVCMVLSVDILRRKYYTENNIVDECMDGGVLKTSI
jgi:hypothetical protein